jgi:hypothetical protein
MAAGAREAARGRLASAIKFANARPQRALTGSSVRSHSRSAMSRPPVKTREPSGETARPQTSPWWPGSERMSWNVSASHCFSRRSLPQEKK